MFSPKLLFSFSGFQCMVLDVGFRKPNPTYGTQQSGGEQGRDQRTAARGFST
jgi:hypothetical protein